MLPLIPVSLPTISDGALWQISPISGSLTRDFSDLTEYSEHNFPSKLRSALKYCHDPFLCPPPAKLLASKKHSEECFLELARLYNRLIKIGNSKFLLSIIYASFQKHLFENTQEAFLALNTIDTTVNKSSQCLQRSLLVAKTSKSFAVSGALFIGAHIPTTEMHAWIIDGGVQPDSEDRHWVNFRPLLAFISR